MPKTYSTYEAKAKFSEILRRVRERGETVTVSYHGEPVAEIRPIPAVRAEGLEARLLRLEQEGALTRSAGRQWPWRPVVRRPGALERFLAERE
ncbi:MAG: type II toxin-antitoxin system Phd/YefM family antitoxin [Longimicrobiales bacterium]